MVKNTTLQVFANTDSATVLAALLKQQDAIDIAVKAARKVFEEENAGKYGVHTTPVGTLTFSEVVRTGWASLLATAKALGLTSVIRETVDATAGKKATNGNAEWAVAVANATGPGGTKIEFDAE